MNIDRILRGIPESVKKQIIDFTDVTLKDGRRAVRVTMDRLLTDDEKKKMNGKKILGLDCVCTYRYAPEIKKSYFYVV